MIFQIQKFKYKYYSSLAEHNNDDENTLLQLRSNLSHLRVTIIQVNLPNFIPDLRS